MIENPAFFCSICNFKELPESFPQEISDYFSKNQNTQKDKTLRLKKIPLGCYQVPKALLLYIQKLPIFKKEEGWRMK